MRCLYATQKRWAKGRSSSGIAQKAAGGSGGAMALRAGSQAAWALVHPDGDEAKLDGEHAAL